MKWMNHLRITYKLLILTVIAVFAMGSIGYTGYSYLQKANNQMEIMYAQKLQSVRLIGDAMAAMRSVQARALQNVVRTKPEELKKGQTQIKDNIAEFEDAWNGYQAIADDAPEVAEKIEITSKYWLTYKKGMQEIGDLGTDGKKAEAAVLYEKVNPDLQKIRDALIELEKMARDNAEEIHQQNSQDQNAAIRDMLVKMVVAFFVLIGSCIWIAREITNPIQKTIFACGSLRDGDFRDLPRETHRRDEFGRMVDVLADMRSNLNQLMKQTYGSTEQIAAASEELTASSTQSAKVSQQIAASVADAADAVEKQQEAVNGSTVSVGKIAVSVKEIQQKADRATENAISVNLEAEAGNEAIGASVGQMKHVEEIVGSTAQVVDKLGERSKEIGQIVDTIAGIAGQTNLLALNAAIEAARAGEHGRGFAVVADEVRKLAEQSQAAAQQIAELISGIQADTGSAVISMQQGRAAVMEGAESVTGLREMFNKISGIIREISSQVRDMSEAVKIVASDAERITIEVNRIDEHGKRVSGEMQSVSAATEEQSAAGEEIASASDSLAKLAQELQLSLQKFKF